MKISWIYKALRRPAPDPQWSRSKQVFHHIYRILLLVLASFLVGAALLPLAPGALSKEVLPDYFCFWQLIVLNTLPVVLLSLAFYGALGRVWCALLFSGIVWELLALINFYKLYFRNEPLYFENLLLFREAAGMVSRGYAPFFAPELLWSLLPLLLLTGLLAFFAPGVLRGWKPRMAALLSTLILCFALVPVYASGKLYDSIRNEVHMDLGRPAENYISRGFLYPFLHSVSSVVDAPLPGYTPKKAEQLLAVYSDQDIPDDRKINVIVIMREAFADLSLFDIPGLDTAPYDGYHALETESYVGDLASNTFGGGTIDAERCFLTGNYTLRNFRSNTNSYLWYFRQQGYTVEGSHPYFEWFYDRKATNPLLGFESYRFWENDFENLCSYHYVPDSILLAEVYRDYIGNKSSGKPYFSFNVTMQTHGRYPTDIPAPRQFLSGPYSEECRNAVDWYHEYFSSANESLLTLVEQLRYDPDPVVVVTFGDHMPWMGNNEAFYDEMGVVLQVTENADPYCTRYLIWANDAAEEILGHDVCGEGPTISPCYLMNLLFQQLDWDGPAFLQAMNNKMDIFSVIHTFDTPCYVVDGVFTRDIPPEREVEFQEFLYLQKYWRNTFLF